VISKRPNILFVMADQLTPGALSAYGNEIVDAPNLAALGEEGVVFERAYCNSPLCTPSRSSLMTGRLPSRIGVYDNGAELPASTPTVAHYLRAAGYRTCLAGKMHFVGPDQLHGFEERITTDFYPAGMHWTPDWTLPLEEHLPWYHDMSSVLDAGVSEATLQLDFDEEVAHAAVRKVYDLARAPGDRPFFLVASFAHPHDPFEAPRAYWDRYDGGVGMPAVGAPAEDPHSRRLRTMSETDRHPISDELVQTARRAYYGLVSYVDDKLGQLLGALDATGLRDDTIVVFAADHGEMLGERGLWYKMTFFEPSARVPLVVHAPARFAPRRVAQNVSLVDLLPTFVELAGGEAPAEPLDGSSLLPLLDGDSAGSDTVVGEYLAEGVFAPLVMIRRGAYKLVHCPGDPDQLFDLSADPHELANLAEDDAHAETAAELRAEVAARWDLEALRDEVLASQRRRHAILDALSKGAQTSWDYEPPSDASGRYVRGRNFWAPFAAARLRPPA
jgi:choline-sulfatase